MGKEHKSKSLTKTSNSEKTILITGASSGIGMESARYFSSMGWRVIATMRSPEKNDTGLEDLKGIEKLRLDVTDPGSIVAALDYVKNKYGHLDVLINNAGFAVYGIFETAELEEIRRQYETNVIGLMSVTKTFLPIFRSQRSGTIINVASVGGIVAVPLYSIYNSTKFAVEGFSEGLSYELKSLNIRVRLIEPGVIRTDFYDRSMNKTDLKGLDEYAPIVCNVEKNTVRLSNKYSKPSVIAKLIYKAAVHKGFRLRFHAGANAGLMINLKKILPFEWFHSILASLFLR